jgi:hypothetical protein
LSILIATLTLALVAVVVLVVSAPLRSSRRGPDSAPDGRGAEEGVREAGAEGAAAGLSPPQSATRGDLEAAREAKYREIRDAELDYRTGKLSREDYEAIDGELRVEAIEILNLLETEEER